ncbi:MAG: slr1658 superfamily regulator [Nannocystaceae bacterium]
MLQDQTTETQLWALGEKICTAKLETELVLTLHPKQFTVRWSQCSATADFCTNYLATREFYQASRGAINYILNELIENAVKFSCGDTIQIILGREDNDVVIVVNNHVAAQSSEKIRATLQALLVGDPLDQMMLKVEQNAENPDSDGSGLGFLTMMTDYDTRVGWQLCQPAGNGQPPRLSTIARLDITQG